MNIIILANIISLVASILMVIGGFFKSKKICLILLCVQLSIVVIAACMLNAISSIIVNSISIFRNVLVYKNRVNTTIKIIMIIAVGIFITVFAHNFIDFLPFIAFLICTCVLDIVDDIQFKWLTNVVMILWTIYDFSFNAYVFFIFDILFMISNNITLFKMYKEKQSIYANIK